MAAQEGNMEKKSIFYAPHADDELLQMGVAIREEIDNGHQVIVVLLTDGASSKSRRVLNGDIKCEWHNAFHNHQEDYRDGFLSKFKYSRARSTEFYHSCLALGVKKENIHLLGFADGGLNKDLVKEIIRYFIELYPAASHNTITYSEEIENHNDHLAAGNALLDYYKQGEINDIRFFVKRYCWSFLEKKDMRLSYMCLKAKKEQRKYLLNAIEAYKCWQPAAGKYACGYHSVADSFNAFEADMVNKYHRPEVKFFNTNRGDDING